MTVWAPSSFTGAQPNTLPGRRWGGGGDGGGGTATSILSFGRDGGGVMHRDVLAAVLVLKL